MIYYIHHQSELLMWPVAMKRSSFQEETEMKMEFQFTGDVNAFVMAMLFGRAFTLTGHSGKTLKVEPKMTPREGMQLNIKPADTAYEKVMTIPVTLPEFGGEALMSFQYKVEDVVVAPAVPSMDALEARPDVLGISDEIEHQAWHTVEDGVLFGEIYLKDGVLLGAKKYEGHSARPAVEARPEVKVPQFKSHVKNFLPIKFE